VVNAPTANTVAAAEHGIALICALARNVAQADASMRAGKWERGKYVGVSLVDKTLAIMGFGKVRARARARGGGAGGRGVFFWEGCGAAQAQLGAARHATLCAAQTGPQVGSEVGRRAKGLGMEVVAYDPYASEEKARAMGVQLVSFDEALAKVTGGLGGLGVGVGGPGGLGGPGLGVQGGVGPLQRGRCGGAAAYWRTFLGLLPAPRARRVALKPWRPPRPSPPQADFFSLHMPMTPGTKKMFNDEAFAKMKKVR
jgi:lactate dehydrogenase-like 2-hydroxyacid dehydrogenase